MKTSIILFFLLFTSLANAHTFGAYEIKIEIIKQNPFSLDKRRVLHIEKNGEKIASQRLYGDPTARLPLTVFESPSEYTFIDCNGNWYSLIKASDKFVKHKWLWEKPLPAHYIGTFRLRKGDKMESFLKEEINLLTVYLFEDPS